jgi:hypothetical protein
MSSFLGYMSSFLVTFGLGFGFALGGALFIFVIAYGVMLFFKRARNAVREDESRNFTPSSSTAVPVKNNPKRPVGPMRGASR